MANADPILAALNAAGKVVLHFDHEPPLIHHQALACEAIIAFLRALPDESIRLPGDAGLLLPYVTQALADAVERCRDE
jgi:hypothetical protein